MPDNARPSPSAASVEIREAAPADIAALAELEAERFASDRLSRRSLKSLAKSGSARVFVACRRGRAIGYAVLLTRKGTRRARLYSIAVAANESGRGVGSRLLASVEAAAEALGADSLQLEVRADNSPAIRFYERTGYAATGQRESYYEDGMTALLYARRLQDTISLSPRRLRRAA